MRRDDMIPNGYGAMVVSNLEAYSKLRRRINE